MAKSIKLMHLAHPKEKIKIQKINRKVILIKVFRILTCHLKTRLDILQSNKYFSKTMNQNMLPF
jgi:hypothetical protein